MLILSGQSNTIKWLEVIILIKLQIFPRESNNPEIGVRGYVTIVAVVVFLIPYPVVIAFKRMLYKGY